MAARDASTDHGRHRSQDQTSETTPKALKNKLVLLSATTGTGKSVVAACLAVSLAEMGYEVGLLDLDLCGPSLTRMFGLEVRPPECESQYQIGEAPCLLTVRQIKPGSLFLG